MSTDNNMFCNFFDSPSVNRTPCFFLENSLCARIATSLMQNLSVNKRGILDSPAADSAKRGHRFRSGRCRRNCFVQFFSVVIVVVVVVVVVFVIVFVTFAKFLFALSLLSSSSSLLSSSSSLLSSSSLSRRFVFYFSLNFYSPFFFFDGVCLCRESNLSFPANQK